MEYAYNLSFIITNLIMGIYRNLIKQIYKSYRSNKALKNYLITVAKANFSSLSFAPGEKKELLI